MRSEGNVKMTSWYPAKAGGYAENKLATTKLTVETMLVGVL